MKSFSSIYAEVYSLHDDIVCPICCILKEFIDLYILIGVKENDFHVCLPLESKGKLSSLWYQAAAFNFYGLGYSLCSSFLCA